VIHIGRDFMRRVGMCLGGIVAMLQIDSAISTTVSMLLSVAVYAAAFGWKFAIGFVLLHELGHVLASRIMGIRTSALLFIPFIGAVVRLATPPQNLKSEANIALGGPALGTLSALVCLAVYFWTDGVLMLALSYTACLINLFNLIPCAPFDGGRIGAAISPYFWRFGSLVLGLVLLFTKNIIILFVFICSLAKWGQSKDEQYYRLNLGQRLMVAWQYFGLLTVLGICTLYLSQLMM
jgi:Zn-dependent protease